MKILEVIDLGSGVVVVLMCRGQKVAKKANALRFPSPIQASL
jgi:hypothetical protein